LKAILNDSDVCHLALVDEVHPYVVALNYGFSWDGDLPVLYFHCAAKGRKLDIIARNPEACVSVDTGHELVRGETGCEWGMKYRSIVGEGLVSPVSDRDERIRALDLIMAHYSGKSGFSYDEKVLSVTVILKMELTAISGKQKA
jgi:nitroimidazol reductase NimA-like FMN-containing flavoprotein (pyridoxamine 5'-phosphate oxidase superfamily)